jgi:hypothetical protein
MPEGRGNLGVARKVANGERVAMNEAAVETSQYEQGRRDGRRQEADRCANGECQGNYWLGRADALTDAVAAVEALYASLTTEARTQLRGYHGMVVVALQGISGHE